LLPCIVDEQKNSSGGVNHQHGKKLIVCHNLSFFMASIFVFALRRRKYETEAEHFFGLGGAKEKKFRVSDLIFRFRRTAAAATNFFQDKSNKTKKMAFGCREHPHTPSTRSPMCET
jgi:hypothetical protein